MRTVGSNPVKTLKNQRPTPVSFTPRTLLSWSRVVVRYRDIMSTFQPAIQAVGLIIVSPILPPIFRMESDIPPAQVAKY